MNGTSKVVVYCSIPDKSYNALHILTASQVVIIVHYTFFMNDLFCLRTVVKLSVIVEW